MKTLVIHPEDPTTEFLSVIYDGKGYTVITDRHIKLSEVLDAVRNHDRIMMMGHGTPHGLIGYSHIFMDKDFIKLLQTKDCVCIWCNADVYVLQQGIKGFYTGMFISEVREAEWFGIDTKQEDIDYSNNLFVYLMKDMIESPNILNEIKSSYIGDCPIINFNNERLYYRDEESVLNYMDILDDLIII
jgi:hypothetical protein